MFGIGEGLGIGGLATGLYGLFHKGRNPADAANKYLNQIPGVANQAYNPYMQAGQNMMGQQNGIYSQMMSNPSEYFNQLASGYKESPGYQSQLKAALGAGTNASAAGGMAGSLQHQDQAMGTASDMANKDFQQYMQNIMGLQQTGLQGGENTQNRGFNATQDWANMQGSNLAQQGGLAAKGADWQNQQNQQNWGNIFGGASMLMPWMFGGGK